METVLTPNHRLANMLLKQFQTKQIQEKKIAWVTPDILPLNAFFRRLWLNYTNQAIDPMPLLLSTQQENVLWKKILQRATTHPLMQPEETAALAEKAWGLLKNWRIDLDHPDLLLTEDSRYFYRWAKNFEKQCQENGWLSETLLPDILANKIIAKEILLPKKIILHGFSELTPLHTYFFTIAEKMGSEIIKENKNKNATQANRVCLPTEKDEIFAMAHWAKQLLENQLPQQPVTIACVIPRLATLRDDVLRIFTEVFSATGTLTADATLLPFNISAGKPLAEWPIIQMALLLLNSHTEPLSLSDAQQILRSPFCGEAEKERYIRATFLHTLRQQNLKKLALNQITCPLLAKRIQLIVKNLPHPHIKKTTTEWATYFADTLKHWGWPGERSINSTEYQLTQRFFHLLTEFSQLDTIIPPETLADALDHLQRLAKNTIYQPETPETPIQISGVLEAAGLPFTHLWMMGLDDNQWPAPPRPHPFIPVHIQKKQNMPHATAERELEYTNHLLTQLCQHAEHVIFSWAAKEAENQLRPSIFLKNLPEISSNSLFIIDSNSPMQQIHHAKKIEYFTDEQAPAVSSTEKLSGGTRILKQQAACPFRAFATIRLRAELADKPVPGLRAIERGIIIHQVLDYFWRKIKDSTTLQKMTPQEENKTLENCIDQAIADFTTGEPHPEQIHLNIERKRLLHLLQRWLRYEKERPAFQVIACEKEITTTLGPMPLRLRMDRLDKTADGHVILIDYKTGKNHSIQHWLDERPEEPQLPLYSILHADTDEKVSAIAFAKLHPEEIKFSGISQDDTEIAGIKIIDTCSDLPWDAQLQSWRNTLLQLSQEFYHGIAAIDPKKQKQTCSTCQLKIVCRIHEKSYAQ